MEIELHTHVDTPDLHLLSLCSGAGMLDMGVCAAVARWGRRARHVAYCEREAAACACLRSRMEEAALEPAPVWCGGLEEFPAGAFHGVVDGITAGFPCQPHSVAGRRRGRHDERNLLPAILAIADAAGAWLLFLENVAGLKAEFDYVAAQLLQGGWNPEWGTLRAADAGASHRRDRWFCVAHRDGVPGGPQRGLESWRREIARAGGGAVPGAAGGGVLADGGRLRGERPGDAGKLGGARVAHQGGHGGEQRAAADGGGGGILAHGAGSRRRAAVAGRGERRGDAAGRGGGAVLADGAGARCVAAGERTDSGAGGRQRVPGAGRGELGDAPGGDGERAGGGAADGRTGEPAGGSGGDVGHGDGAGFKREGPAESAGRIGDFDFAGTGLPVFAPGPDDPAWGGILAVCPFLAPALPDGALRRAGDLLDAGSEVAAEPAFLRVADGVAADLVRDRADMLRIAGNGVVPQQAAHAFTQLIGRILK